jgi:hypothetical protein
MLDEPYSVLDRAETHRFAWLAYRHRRQHQRVVGVGSPFDAYGIML